MDNAWSPELEAIAIKEGVATLDLTSQVTISKDSKGIHSGFATISQGTWTDKSGKTTQVAVKVLHIKSTKRIFEGQLVKRLLREVLLWKSVNEEYVVPLFGFIRDPPALISPWHENGDVVNYLEQNPKANRFHLFLDVVKAVNSLHPNLVHGDIKGENVLVTEDGRAILCDFGSAKLQDILTTPRGLTTSNDSTVSTINFQSPELLSAEKPIPTTASDIWALGCVAIQIVAKKRPWDHVPAGSHIFAPKAISGELRPLDPQYIPPNNHERAFWKELIRDNCWKLDPQERPSAETFLLATKKFMTIRMDPYVMSDHLNSVCIASGGTEISSVLLRREFGLEVDDFCWEVIQTLANHEKVLSRWDDYFLSIRDRHNNAKEFSLTDRPLQIFQKEDFTTKPWPRLSFRYRERDTPLPDPHFGATVEDSYDHVLATVLKTYGLDEEQTQCILLIVCKNGDEECVRPDQKPMQMFSRLEQDGHSPRFEFRRAKRVTSPTSVMRMSYGDLACLDDRISVLLEHSAVHPEINSKQDSTYAISILPDKLHDVLIDSCFRVDKEEGKLKFIGTPLTTENLIAPYNEMQQKHDLASFLLLNIHPYKAILNTQRRHFIPQQTYFKTYHPILPEFLASSENNVTVLVASDHNPVEDYQVVLRRGEAVRLLRRWQHWCYVIKKTGEQGWAPYWKLAPKL